MTILKTIEQHNAERLKLRTDYHNPEQPSGIACPQCGAEMLKNTSISLTSDPPQTPVRCTSCGYATSIMS